MKWIACAVVLGSMIATTSGCVEQPSEEAPGAPEIGLAREGDGVAGTLRVTGERISISARSAGGVVRVEVAGEGGARYASVERDLADNVTSGRIGGQSFGRAEDLKTDLDLALWSTIARSRSGDVLRAVSAAAAPLAAQGEHLAVRDELVTLAKLSPMLASMTLDEEAGTTLLGACSSRSLRVSVTGGTAYLNATNCDGTRTGSVVNECSGSTIYWRVRSVSTGDLLNSGSRGNCAGGGVGTFYQSIKVQVLNAYGYWEGVNSP